MLGLRAAVAAHVEVPAFFGGNDAEVLGLGLGALAHAAAHAAFQLVGRADALVAVLNFDGKRHAVVQPVAAPGTAHAAFHGAQALAIGVPALKTRVNQLLPDVGQIADVRPKHINPLSARNLGVETILFGHAANHHQLLGRDFAPRDARHHRVAAALLNVGQISVIGVLNGVLLHNQVVPQAGQDAAQRRLAGFAAIAGAKLVEGRVVAANVVDFQ